MKWARTFVLAFAVGVIATVAFIAWTRPSPAPAGAHRLPGSIWVSEQVNIDQISSLRASGFRALVDLRPDGEAADQAPSSAIAAAAADAGLGFAYVPVPHGDIPRQSVDALTKALAQVGRPVLLYCRSGRRAARTWALAEASRPGGLTAVDIASALREVQQPVDDLRDQIERRVAARRAGL